MPDVNIEKFVRGGVHFVKKVLSLSLVLSILAGCASSQAPSVYSRSQAQRAQQVTLGTVQYVREIRIEGTQSGAGNIAGAVMGGLLGSAVGSGAGRRLATGAGAIGGAAAGGVFEEGATRANGYEITVKLEDGRTMAIVQAKDANNEVFTPGDKVRVLQNSDGSTRVTH
jgi:outer membrane lipoprotein SlyB